MDEQARYERAKKQAEELRDFYQHLVIYLVINAFLLLLNLRTSPGHLWFYWPLFGWGLGVAIHGATVFGSNKFWGQQWQERKIKQLMEKDRSDGPMGS